METTTMKLIERKVSFRKDNEKKLEKLIKKLNRYCKLFDLPKVEVNDLGDKNKLFLINEKHHSVIVESFNMEDIEKEMVKWAKKKLPLSLKTLVYKNISLLLPEALKPHDEWDLLGVIDQNEGIVKPAPGKQIPTDFLEKINLKGNFSCEQCNKSIYRKKGIVVKNINNVEIKRVGGSCTKVYLGYDYENKLDLLDIVYTIEEGFGGEPHYGWFDKVEDSYSVKELIKTYIYHVNEYGQISNKEAGNYNRKLPEEDYHKRKTSTSNKVSNTIHYVYNPPISNKHGEYDDWQVFVAEHNEKLSKIDDTEYDEIVEFANKNNDNNFMFNVVNLIKEGTVSLNYMNYIPGLCSYFYSIKKREEAERVQKELNEKKYGESKHLGEIGEKLEFKDLKVTRIGSFENEYGVSYIYNMIDPEGNIVVKFGKINPRYSDTDDVKVGSILNFKSSIKQHSEYKGIKQTVIDRLSKL
jgi:hypothetical protein